MSDVDLKNVPRHVAIIMDGNGRWAKERNLSRTQGHIEGVRRVEDTITIATELGVEAVTLYTFSTENWNRPQTEVSMLMKMITEVLNKRISKLQELNVRFQTIGRKDGTPESVLKAIDFVKQQTQSNTGLVLNMAFNYGGRLEIIDAVKSIAERIRLGELGVEDITEDEISEALYTKNLPDPDLLIRTSGEKRISNFLLWQLSYAEFYFSDKYWPDFTQDEFKKAVLEYQSRERRFGNLKIV
ncbi:MAG: isoprenyl transferase [Candidatus Omnitrophica bacterium]|nr:isoprenyl transferase [Candidatus Omnitrophota bacterium]